VIEISNNYLKNYNEKEYLGANLRSYLD